MNASKGKLFRGETSYRDLHFVPFLLSFFAIFFIFVASLLLFPLFSLSSFFLLFPFFRFFRRPRIFLFSFFFLSSVGSPFPAKKKFIDFYQRDYWFGRWTSNERTDARIRPCRFSLTTRAACTGRGPTENQRGKDQRAGTKEPDRVWSSFELKMTAANPVRFVRVRRMCDPIVIFRLGRTGCPSNSNWSILLVWISFSLFFSLLVSCFSRTGPDWKAPYECATLVASRQLISRGL